MDFSIQFQTAFWRWGYIKVVQPPNPCPEVDWNHEDALFRCFDKMGKAPTDSSRKLTKKGLLRLMTALENTGYASIDESFKYMQCAVLSSFLCVSMSCVDALISISYALMLFVS